MDRGAIVEEAEQSFGAGVMIPMKCEEQVSFQFVVDIDRGLGTSRKRYIFTSGLVPFF